MIKIQDLIDEQQCYEKVRKLRWSDGVSCPHCMGSSEDIVKRGKSGRTEFCQRYHCKQCDKDFDDLTNTIFTGRHQSLKTRQEKPIERSKRSRHLGERKASHIWDDSTWWRSGSSDAS